MPLNFNPSLSLTALSASPYPNTILLQTLTELFTITTTARFKPSIPEVKLGSRSFQPA
jgi:hypothetical protein